MGIYSIDKFNSRGTLLTALLLLVNIGFCQSPDSFNYQGVIRDQADDPLSDQAVLIWIRIHEGSETGSLVYSETHNVTTNSNGLFNLVIGEGAVFSGSFAAINWATEQHFLRVLMDVTGGASPLVEMGVQQLISVPYALHANTVSLATGPELEGTGTTSDPLVIAQSGASVGDALKWNGAEWLPSPDSQSASPWSVNGTDVYYDIGGVGVGTNSPDGAMEISAPSSFGFPQLNLHSTLIDYARMNFTSGSNPTSWSMGGYAAFDNINSRFTIWNSENNYLLSLTGDGRLGLGENNLNPLVDLHVAAGGDVLFGSDTTGSGRKMMFLEEKGAFRTGYLSNTAGTFWDADSVGSYSFASGWNTRARGNSAVAMGFACRAEGNYSAAFGYDAKALAYSAHATGFLTTASGYCSSVSGSLTQATGSFSVAQGYDTEAEGIYSTSTGLGTLAGAHSAAVFGRYNIGNGDADNWVLTDPILEVGIGSDDSNRNNAMTILKNGWVGIGANIPQDLLHVTGRVRIGSGEIFEDAGSFTLSLNSDLVPYQNGARDLGSPSLRWNTVYAQNGTINTSDKRDKTRINSLDYGMDEIMKLNPVSFKWKGQEEQGNKLGLIAQELQKVLPEVVVDTEWITDEETGKESEVDAERLGVYYSDIIPVLIKGMQEQQEMIQAQQKQILELQKRLELDEQ